MVKKDAYERILTEEKTDSAKGPFVSFYRQVRNSSWSCHLRPIGRDMLIGATISSVSSPQFAEVGTRAGSVSHVRFVEKDSSIVMQAINSELLDALPAGNAKLAQVMNYRNLDFYSFPIKARNKRLEVFSLMFFFLFERE